VDSNDALTDEPQSDDPLDGVETTNDTVIDGVKIYPCASCGDTEAPDANGRCRNPMCGKFRKNHTVNLIHGGRARPLLADQQRRDEIFHAVQADPSRTILAQFEKDYADACVMRDILARYLTTAGPMTEAGRRRAALDAYLAASARTERLSLAILEARRAVDEHPHHDGLASVRIRSVTHRIIDVAVGDVETEDVVALLALETPATPDAPKDDSE
jgi:hypothetical protein